jgi:acyl transferase domain-containing protein
MLAGDLAAAMTLKAHGVKADAAAGFSLGEYAALAYAGVISFPEVFRLIQIRADAMQEAVAPGEGGMAAFVGAAAEQVEELCAKVTKGYVVAANYNSPVQTVVSGSAAGVDEACALADAAGLRCVKLAVSAPFHCALMEPAARRLEEEFKSVAFNRPSVPVYMNVDGNPVTDGAGIAGTLNTGMPMGLRVLDCYVATRPVRELAYLRADVELEYDSGVPSGAVEALRELFARSELVIQKRTKRKDLADVDIAPMIRSVAMTEGDGVIRADVTVQAQNPGLNPQLLGKAIERYLPELTPDFIRVRRKAVLDAEGNDFR